MLMARFCARVRKRADLPSVSMKDVYAHPTVRGLAGALGPQASPLEQPFAAGAGRGSGCRRGAGRRPLLRRPGRRFDGHGAVLRPRPQARRPAHGVDEGRLPPPDDQQPGDGSAAPDGAGPDAVPASPTGRAGGSTGGYGALRPVRRCCSSCASSAPPILGALVMAWSYEWVSAASDLFEIYRRAVVAGGAAFLGACLLPILAKWVLDRPVDTAADPRSGAWRTSASGSSRRWCGPTRCFSWPEAGRTPAAVRRSTCSTCARWARRSAGTSRSSPGTCRCAPTCSPSATTR